MRFTILHPLIVACVLTPVRALPSASPPTSSSLCHAVCSGQLPPQIACSEQYPVKTQLDKCSQCLQTNPSVNGGTAARWYSSALRNAITTCLSPRSGPQSACATDKSCLSLKEVLARDQWDAPLDSCTGSLTSCMACLHEDKRTPYLYGSLLTLETLCQQQAYPNHDFLVLSRSADTAPDFSAGAIAGVIVAFVLLFLLVLGLFLIYFGQQRRFRKAHRSPADSHLPLPPESARLAADKHRSRESLLSLASNTSHAKIHHVFDPRSTNRGPDAALPTHHAYIPHPHFKPTLQATEAPPASLAVLPDQPPRSDRPDSFILRTYMDAARHPANSPTTPQPLPLQDRHHASAAASPLPAAHSAPSRSRGAKVLALQIPPLPKLKFSKMQSPLKRLSVEPKSRMQISRPILQTDGHLDAHAFSHTLHGSEDSHPVSRYTAWKQSKTADHLSIRSPKSILYG